MGLKTLSSLTKRRPHKLLVELIDWSDQVFTAVLPLPAKCAWVNWGEVPRGFEEWLRNGGLGKTRVPGFHEGVGVHPAAVRQDFWGGALGTPFDPVRAV